MNVTDELRTLAERWGLVAFGVTTAAPFPAVGAEMDRRREAGTAGRLRFTYTDPEVATDIGRTFPWARRLVVGAVTYLPDSYGRRPGSGGQIARFATEDHYRPLREGLGRLAARLGEAGYRAEVLVDDNRLVDRAAAVRAGIGWWGKSTMVLAPKYGPWLLLGSIATDAELETTDPMARSCGTCTACIPACPTGALDVPGVLDATRCISYWAQTPGVIPADIRNAWGSRLYGCDECLTACPPGERWLDAAPDGTGVDLVELLAQSDAELLARYGHFYIPRRDVRFLRRNALVALGHSGKPEAHATLTAYLHHSDWLLRLHAAASLGRLGTRASQAALEQAAGEEQHEAVIEVIRLALSKPG